MQKNPCENNLSQKQCVYAANGNALVDCNTQDVMTVIQNLNVILRHV